MAALPKLLATAEEGERALAMCWEIAGPREEMSQPTLDMMNRAKAFAGRALPGPPGGSADP
jgi:hypothetical protein